jgi:HD-GYP domain-containing protein (c-di-GMP phosphodiesterase class II)
MPVKSSRVMVAVADLTEVLVIRRLLRDTPYLVDVVRSRTHLERALEDRQYSVVITDDHHVEGMSGAALLDEVARVQPKALRILLADKDRKHELLTDVGRDEQFRVAFRPYFAAQMQALLLQQLMREHPVPAPLSIDIDLTQPDGAPADDRDSAYQNAGRPASRQLLLTLAELVEAKTCTAHGHAVRVSALSVALGREVRLGESDLNGLDEAALLHDVGELAVPTAVLQLKRRLTPPERRQLRSHVESSYRVVRQCGLPRNVQLAVLHHHERWDGRGYPGRLSGTGIPLWARILTVADVWDAIAAARPYRGKSAVEDCVRALSQLGGTQLDADLVGLFLDRKLYHVVDWADPPRGSAELLTPAGSS